jgi:hypothetical protein
MSTDNTEKQTHRDGCASRVLLSQYDKTCPRCAQIWKVIQLRRRTTANGSSVLEAESAARLADLLASKFQLARAELVDRLYASPTNQLVIPVVRRAKSKPCNADNVEGLDT